MRRRPRAAFALFAVLALPESARAYRPFNSTDAAVAEKGMVELELGPLGLLSEGSERSLVAPSVILNWGIAERWELVLEGRHFIRLRNDPSGPRLRVEDAAASLKTVLREGSLQEKDGVSVAVEVSALLPAINGEPGAGAEAAVIASQRSYALTLHLNGAVSWTRAHTLGLFGGLIVEGRDAWPVRPVAEVFVEHERDLPTTLSWLTGAIWRLGNDLSVDAAFRLARAGGEKTTEIRAGLTWAFGVGFPNARRKP